MRGLSVLRNGASALSRKSDPWLGGPWADAVRGLTTSSTDLKTVLEEKIPVQQVGL